jgi:hypothetical protein
VGSAGVQFPPPVSSITSVQISADVHIASNNSLLAQSSTEHLLTAATQDAKVKASSKVNFQVNVIPKPMQRLVPSLGMTDAVVELLGSDWKDLCESWIQAEAALTGLGGVVSSLEDREIPVPGSLIAWYKSHRSKESNMNAVDFSSIASDMPFWCKKILPKEGKLDAEAIVKTHWCVGGLSGIVLILVGMKEWGMMSTDEPQWSQMAHRITKIFQIIPTAESL